MLKQSSTNNSKQDDPDAEKTPVQDFDNGTLVREYSHFAKESCSKGGHYRIVFPRSANLNEKLLLVSAAMMLDMMFYDRKCCVPFVNC